MRLFVAIDLDEQAQNAIADEQRRLVRALGRDGGSLRWVWPDQMHLTLVFIGNADEVRAHAIVDTMHHGLAASPFAMVFTGVGVFPPQGAPNVLWLGVGAGAREAVDLQRAVAERLEMVGVARERRPFHPHLTLARWRSSKPSDRRRVLAASGDDDVARIDVRVVALYRSHLSSAGPTYEVLARAPLGT